MRAFKFLSMWSMRLCICLISFQVTASDQVKFLWKATPGQSTHFISQNFQQNVDVFDATTASNESNAFQIIIRDQLDAFSDNDFRKAFLFAHFSIVLMFETPENFSVMIKRDWPMMLSPKRVTFLESIEGPETAEQDVKIVDHNGITHYVRYFFTKSQGTWKISGVEIISSSGAVV